MKPAEWLVSGVAVQGTCDLCGSSAGQVKLYKVGKQQLCLSHAMQEDPAVQIQAKEGQTNIDKFESELKSLLSD